MHPWYKGFLGEIIPQQNGKNGYEVKGKFEVLDENTLEITELPIGKWTRDYKTFLEELADTKNGEIIDEIREHHTENRVHFIVKCNPGKLA
jgi:DNA topoisomerase-2